MLFNLMRVCELDSDWPRFSSARVRLAAAKKGACHEGLEAQHMLFKG